MVNKVLIICLGAIWVEKAGLRMVSDPGRVAIRPTATHGRPPRGGLESRQVVIVALLSTVTGLPEYTAW